MKVLKKEKSEIREIGAFEIAGRRKPVLGIKIGTEVLCFGYFNSRAAADDFMIALGEFVGAEPEKEDDNGKSV